MKRINSIDVTRGLVMIIMAIDHVRDLIHEDSISASPTNLTTTSPILFFTRWITYLCAPTFVFLAGTSAWLSYQRNNDAAKSRAFLLKRGLYLLVLEFLAVNFALYFDIGFHTLLFEVIAAIGLGFIVLSPLITLPANVIGIIGLVIIFAHNLVPLIPLPETSLFKRILVPFFAPAAFPFSKRVLIIAYPPIPWLGIMLTGFASGRIFSIPGSQRKNLFIKIGVASLLLFIILRFINVYGDPAPWAAQKNAIFTCLSFMSVSKYPPSLIFCLVTLGVMFIILALSEEARGKLVAIVAVYGKVPLFYFLAHFFLIHCILIFILLLQGIHFSAMDFTSGTFGRPGGVKTGLPLWAVYLVWIVVVTVLYKPCQWYWRYKTSHAYWWLKYL